MHLANKRIAIQQCIGGLLPACSARDTARRPRIACEASPAARQSLTPAHDAYVLPRDATQRKKEQATAVKKASRGNFECI